MLVAMNNHNVVVSLRKGGLWLAPLLALLLVGCKDPYSDKPGNFPPPVDDRNKQFGSLQQVYQQPKLTPATRTAPSGSVSRTTVALGKNPIFYGDPDAPVTIVEFSDFE